MTPTPIEKQLRLYGDSLDAADPPATVTELRPVSVSRAAIGRSVIWTLGAAAVALVALLAFGNRGPVEVETGDFAEQPTAVATAERSIVGPTSEPAVESMPRRRYLLPDVENWVVTEDYRRFVERDRPEAPSIPAPAIWVWELDGDKLVLFQTGTTVAYGEPVPLAEAEIEGSGERSLVGWRTPTGRVGLLAFNVDVDELSSIARQLDQDVVDPTIAGATLLVHEPERLRDPLASEQIELAPVGPDGVAALKQLISASARRGTPGDMYRELGEASGLGEVTDVSIAGFDGFFIEGSFQRFTRAYALVAADGWIYHWSTESPEVDLSALVQSVAEVTEAEWEQALGQKDANVVAAADAAALQAGIEQDNLFPPADLPRFALPEPWEIEWVTDMGIWTNEQRAQRAGMVQASVPATASALAGRTQVFRFTPTGNEPAGFVAGAEVSIAVFESAPTTQSGFQEGSTPIRVAGLTGMASPENLAREHQLGALNTIELEGGNVRVFIQSQTLAQEDLSDFAGSLVWRTDEPGDGFDATDSRFDLLVDEVDVPGLDVDSLLAPATNWLAAWRYEGDPSRSLLIDVEQLPLNKAPLEFARSYPSLASNIVESSGPHGHVELRVDAPGIAMRYDSRTEIYVVVSAKGGQDSPTDIIDNTLIELDLEEWIRLVAPFNADPLNGR